MLYLCARLLPTYTICVSLTHSFVIIKRSEYIKELFRTCLLIVLLTEIKILEIRNISFTFLKAAPFAYNIFITVKLGYAE